MVLGFLYFVLAFQINLIKKSIFTCYLYLLSIEFYSCFLFLSFLIAYRESCGQLRI